MQKLNENHMTHANKTVPTLIGLALYKYLINIIQKQSVLILKMKTTLQNVNQLPFQGSNIHWQLLKRKTGNRILGLSISLIPNN